MAAAISEILLKNSRGHGQLLLFRPLGCVKMASSSSQSSKDGSGDSGKKTLYDSSLTAMKRGTSGRSSFSGIVATVFGATGLVGRYVVNKLGKMGTQVIIPYRGDHYEVLRLKLAGDLGQILFSPYNLRDEASIRKAMKHSNVVINLIGRDWESMNYKFGDVNITGARTIAKIARETGVKRLIHFSSLNCSPHPHGVILPDGSEFLRTKYEGEMAVRDEYPDVTIFRPSDIWGKEDRFLQYYSHQWRRTTQLVALWDRGEKTIKQPVFVSDVAQGVVNAIKDPETAGLTYDIVGPTRYRLSELVDYMFAVMRRDEDWGYRRVNLRYSPFFQLRVSLTQKLCPGWPVAYLGWDKMERDHVTDTLTKGNPKLEHLGVALTPLEGRIHWELKHRRAYNYYDAEVGEFPEAVPPKPVLNM